MIKICHVTNVHSSDDARIFHKECTSLSKAGYSVTLVAPGDSREQNGVRVIGCGEKPKSRFQRATSFAKKIIDTALREDCDVYHLHDPELLLYALKIKRHGKKVIFDSHEDYFFEKEYLPKPIRKAVSKTYLFYESYVISRLDGLICCYRKTKDRLGGKCLNCEMVYNFPIIGEEPQHNHSSNIFTIGYAGGISAIWNHEKLIRAISDIDNIQYVIAGRCYDNYLETLKTCRGWNKVDFLGVIPFDKVQERIYSEADLGVALLGYIPECNGKEGNLSNTKLFEIMHAGLPVIATDFDLWKEVVEKNQCGICVDPYSVEKIGEAIRYLVDHPEERRAMGKNARNAILNTYNWGKEEEKLISLYERIN